MGWTEQRATHYYRNGRVNIKKECDAYFLEGINKGFYRIFRSAMVGSTYYAAVQKLKRGITNRETEDEVYEDIPEDELVTFAVIFRTTTDRRSYDNFAYKDMTEFDAPGQRDCPENILKLLSDTDSKDALEWRNKCHEYNAIRKALNDAPIGTVVKTDKTFRTPIRKYTKCQTGNKIRWVDLDAYRYTDITRLVHLNPQIINKN